MQNISRDCHRRVLPGKRHSGRTLYAKAQSEPYAYNSSGLTCHLKEAVRARNSIEEPDGVGSPGRPFSKKKTRKDGAHSQDPARGKHRARKAAANAGLQGPGKRPQGIETRIPFRREP